MTHEHKDMNQGFPDLNPVVPTIGWKWIPCMDDAAISRLPRFRFGCDVGGRALQGLR